MSGLLVAAITTTFFRETMPSISERSWFTMRSVTPESLLPLPRCGAIESISSKKMMHGAVCLAFLKISLTAFSDSPTHLLSTSGPLTLMKLAELSVATAFARSVLPVPGGP